MGIRNDFSVFFCVKYLTFCNVTCECLISGFLMGSMLLLVSCLVSELVAQQLVGWGPVEDGDGHLTTRHQIKPVRLHLFVQGSQCVQSQLWVVWGQFQGSSKSRRYAVQGGRAPNKATPDKTGHTAPHLFLQGSQCVQSRFHKANYGWGQFQGSSTHLFPAAYVTVKFS